MGLNFILTRICPLVVKIIAERSSKQSLGFAYVWFDCEEAAQLAVEEMDGKVVIFQYLCVI